MSREPLAFGLRDPTKLDDPLGRSALRRAIREEA